MGNLALHISRLIDRVNETIGKLVAVAVLIDVLISAGNAFSRHLFNASSNAWLEIQWYLFSAMFLLGAAYTLKLNEHVRVDIVYGALSDKAQDWINLLGGLLFLLPMTALICWMAWPMFWSAFVSGETSPNAGGLIRWPVKLLLPAGFALLTLQGISEVIKSAAALLGHRELHQHYEKPLQ